MTRGLVGPSKAGRRGIAATKALGVTDSFRTLPRSLPGALLPIGSRGPIATRGPMTSPARRMRRAGRPWRGGEGFERR